MLKVIGAADKIADFFPNMMVSHSEAVLADVQRPAKQTKKVNTLV